VIPSSCAACANPLSLLYPEVEDPQTREHFAILACGDCGLGHTSPVPDDLSRFYGAQYYGGRHGVTQALCLRRQMRMLERFGGRSSKEPRLLDVGCGEGIFLQAARERGWDVAGTELSTQLPHRRDFPIHASIADAGSGYTCVTLWHSLEHLRDPRAALTEVAAALVPAGTVLIAVPNAQGAQARLFGPRWRHLDVPRHLFHFGVRSLEQLLSRSGLEPFWRWHQELEYDLSGWAQSLLNALPFGHDFLLRSLSDREPSRTRRLAGLALGGALGALAFPVSMAMSLAGSGGTLVVAARRKELRDAKNA
jgi:SAM-dependent methyltransferase